VSTVRICGGCCGRDDGLAVRIVGAGEDAHCDCKKVELRLILAWCYVCLGLEVQILEDRYQEQRVLP
jgi:hypothetical protein